MIDEREPFSPGWWLVRLAKGLLAKRTRLDLMQAYLDDMAALPGLSISRGTQQAYSRLRKLSRTNFAELIVEAPRERMRPSGFRTGSSGTDQTDRDAWRIWQANGLDADSAIVHRTCLGLGEAYVIVGPPDPRIDAPVITHEDPREVIVEHDVRLRRMPRAALKMFRDVEAGYDVAYLYLPGEILRARRDARASAASAVTEFMSTEWTFDAERTVLPASIVPVTRFANKPDGRSEGHSEFEAHLNLLDRVNYQVLQRLEIATMQAFRQRAIKGVPALDKTGKPIDYSDIFAAAPGALWMLPKDADLWESQQVDLTGVREAIKDDVQLLAAVTRTPLYYLHPDATNGSAEGASLAKEGLVYKTEDRIAQVSESWEAVMRNAFLLAGDSERGRFGDTQVLWEPVERFSLAERYDAATKAVSAGVPWRQVMQAILQFSPQEVDRMQAERATDALFASLGAASSSAAGPAATPTTVENGMTPTELAQASNALGQFIRAGVRPESAAAQIGLEGLEFTGAVPVSLRLPETDAADLEGA